MFERAEVSGASELLPACRCRIAARITVRRSYGSGLSVVCCSCSPGAGKSGLVV